MLFPVPSILDFLGPAVPFIAAVLVLYGQAKIAPRIIGIARQRANDNAAAAETRRIELSIGRGQPGSQDRAVALIRALHPQEELGLGGWWPRGWPTIELRAGWRNGKLVWQVDATRDTLRLVEVALSAAHPGVEVREVERRDMAPVWSPVGRLRKPASNPLGDPSSGGAALLSRLAVLLESTSPLSGGEVRYRVVVRPIDPKAWQHALYPESAGRSIWSYVWEDILDTIFGRPHREPGAQPTLLSPPEREAQQRKRAGRVGFEVGLVLEVAGAGGE